MNDPETIDVKESREERETRFFGGDFIPDVDPRLIRESVSHVEVVKPGSRSSLLNSGLLRFTVASQKDGEIQNILPFKIPKSKADRYSEMMTEDARQPFIHDCLRYDLLIRRSRTREMAVKIVQEKSFPSDIDDMRGAIDEVGRRMAEILY